MQQYKDQNRDLKFRAPISIYQYKSEVNAQTRLLFLALYWRRTNRLLDTTDYFGRFVHFVQLVEAYVSDIWNVLLESMVESEGIRETLRVFEMNVLGESEIFIMLGL